MQLTGAGTGETAKLMTAIPARHFHKKALARAHQFAKGGNYGEAERIYREYLLACPDDPQVCFNVGALIQKRAVSHEEFMDAFGFYERAAASEIFDDTSKAAAVNNLGLIMIKVGRVDYACGLFMRSVLLNPQCAAAVSNYADALAHLGRHSEAMAAFDESKRLNPQSAEAHFGAGMISIMLGDWKSGWEGYEHRFDVAAFPTKRIESKKPIWSGQELFGKTLLVTTEQGYGDQFQFARYAREIKRRWSSCRVWYYGQNLVLKTMLGAGFDEVFDAIEPDGQVSLYGGPQKTYDFHVPLMSLPHRFETTIETCPGDVPYIQPGEDWPKIEVGTVELREPVYSKNGAQVAEAVGDKKKVGIAWAGSPRHGKDRFRSIDPELFQPIIDAHPECQFYSLQVGPRQHEVSRLRNVIDLAPAICAAADWSATATALQQLDLLISVDTAVVHLAGALARPVWMLTPSAPDFRWMLNRTDSPYYPTLKIFRQPTAGDWATPLKQINDAL